MLRFFVCFGLAFCFLASQLDGQTWTGAGVDDNWTTSANWSGGVPTSGAGTVLFFDAVANQNSVNDIAPMMLNEMRFTASGYALSGTAIEFTGSDPELLVNYVGTSSIGNDLTISTATRINGLNSTDSILNFLGSTSGAGSLLITDSTVIVDGALNNSEIEVSFNGAGANAVLQIDGTVNAGTNLQVFGDSTSAGMLSGTGVISRGVDLTQGKLSSTGTLTITDDLTLEALGGLECEIVSGTISISGTTSVCGPCRLSAGATLGGAGDVSLQDDGFLILDGGTIGSGKTVFFEFDFGGNPGFNAGGLTVPEDVSATLDNDFVGIDAMVGSGSLQFFMEENSTLTMNGNLCQNDVTRVEVFGTTDPESTPPNIVVNGDWTLEDGGTIRSQMIGGTGTITFAGTGQVGTNLAQGTVIGPDHTVIVDGALTTGILAPDSGEPDPVVNAPTFFNDGSTLRAREIGPPLTFNSTVTFNGTTFITFTFGTLEIQTHIFNDMVSVSSGILTIGPGQTVTGSGSLVISDGANVVNNGILKLSIVAQGDLDGGTGSEICSDVVLETATASGVLDIEGTMTVRTSGDSFIDTGAMVDVEGTTTVEEGKLAIAEMAMLLGTGDVVAEPTTALTVNGVVDKSITIENDALLEGAGEINGDVDVSGMLGPGNSAGTLDIDGCVVLDKGSVTIIEVGGTMPGAEHDQVNNGNSNMMANQFVLAGILQIQLIENFYPRSADNFVIIRGFDIQGSFDNVVDGRVDLGNGMSFAVELVPGEIPGTQDMVLTNFSPPLGDGNADGVVNLLDVQPFVNAISAGKFFEPLDINRDGAVNLLDVAGFIELLAGG